MRMRLSRFLPIIPFMAACVSPPVEAPTVTVEQATNISSAQTVKNKVDILFMVDNSPSMQAMQTELQSKFSTFLNVFDNLARPKDSSTPQYADLHIGVVTSDYGAGTVASKSGSAGCDATPGGQKGLIQAKGASADASCGVPTGSAYIQYAFGASGDTCNLPGGTCNINSLNTQFTCAASVGANGCGFEHQLESVYAALTTSDATNAGFLRDDAILAVVFVTNEDDGSAPPGSTFYNNDPSTVGTNGAYNTYRQTHFGVQCGSPAALTPEAAASNLMNCVAAPNASAGTDVEFDVSRYTNLFTQSGKLKANPSSDIILVGIQPPTSPVSTLLAMSNTGNGLSPNPSYVPCGAIGQTCNVQLQHSCQNTAQPAFFGDPPIRLNTVIQSASQKFVANICGADLSQSPDYSSALTSVANLIVSALKPSCLTAPIKSTTVNGNTQPDCTVEDVTATTQTQLPYCPTAGGQLPCWQEDNNPQCPFLCNPQSSKLEQPGITITRDANVNGGKAPDGTTAQISCNTIALANEDPYAACGGKPDGGI